MPSGRQYEVITGPLPPLEAADALVFTRETIYNVANKHGFKATFSPRLHLDSCEPSPVPRSHATLTFHF